jgi:hypothetical protein
LLTLFEVFEKQRWEVYAWHRKLNQKTSFSKTSSFVPSLFYMYAISRNAYIYTSYFNLHFRNCSIPIQPHLRLFLVFSWSIVRMKWTKHLHYHQAYTQFLIKMSVKNAFKHLLECYHQKENRVPEYKQEQLSFSLFKYLCILLIMISTDQVTNIFLIWVIKFAFHYNSSI